MKDLLQVEDAQRKILDQLEPPEQETITTTEALGRVLAKNIEAPISLPPFANSAMDGFAVRAEDVNSEGRRLRVVADIPAGVAPDVFIAKGEAARIMTGAPMPDGADAVVPIERTDATFDVEEPLDEETSISIQGTVETGAHVRPVGENIRSGEQVLAAGVVLRPQDIGMLVGLGVTQIVVYRRPKAIVVGSGDELVGPDEPLTPGKIRDTNSWTISAMLTELGAEVVRLPPARDTAEHLHALFDTALSHEPDLIVSTAGVSVGAFDIVRAVLEERGEIGFWKVNVRPGKPLAFGKLDGIPFFGLPGNPVSAMVTFDVFVRPALRHLSGLPVDIVHAVAITDEEITSDGRRTYARVKLRRNGDQLFAKLTGTQSSGALMSMVLADGLLIIPDGETHVAAGTKLEVRLLRDLHFAI